MTGRIEAIMIRVSSQEMINTITKEAMIKMTALISIETLVVRPSWTTAISDPSLLTK